MQKKCKNVFYIRKKDNEELVKYLSTQCGDKADTKCIPQDIKNMSCDNLKVLLEALVDGDGSIRLATVKKSSDKKYYSYTTTSRQLRDDVVEILFKLGYSPRFNTIEFDSDKLNTQYTISWSPNSAVGDFPVLDTRSKKIDSVISDYDYEGKVWCVEVPNHFIITERNGKFGIHGNSAASIGIESTIERLESFRREIATWVENNIYLPEAKRQGFVEIDEDTGEEEFIVPTIKWNSMHLRDQQQYRQSVLQLYEKGLLSAQTVLEVFDFNPDQEIERKRYDALQMQALGGGIGGDDGGMGGGFAGDMGGMPGMGGGDIGGDIGGGEMGGMPGMGGGDAMGGGEMAGGPVASSNRQIKTAQDTQVSDPSQYGGKILTKKTRERLDSEHQKTLAKTPNQGAGHGGKTSGPTRDDKGRVVFTEPEMELLDGITRYQQDGLLRYRVIPQFPVQYGSQEYPLDFAIPQLKIGLEADGEMFHSNPKQLAHDKERDKKLAQLGWTILRFKDEEIKKKIEQVMQTVLKSIMKKESLLKEMMNDNK